MSGVILSRRSLLVGGLSTLFAPAVVRVASLMPIKPIIEGVSVAPRHTIWTEAWSVTITRIGPEWIVHCREAAGRSACETVYWGDMT